VAVRIYALLARKARRAVVFRRGPSKRVLLLDWRTDTDTFVPGQWLKGRIYERRSDLSPGGHKLAYFAASWKRPFQTWTAISRPPWLTAVALWPKGDAWGGGALFDDETHVRVNHFAQEIRLADGFTLPRHVKVTDCGAWSGRGEDIPIWYARLVRDGWTQTQVGVEHRNEYLKERVWFVYDPPQVWSKPSPTDDRVALQMILRGIKETNGAWYLTEHAVAGAKGERFAIGESDWADWDANGDLLFAQDGIVFRAKAAKAPGAWDVRPVADLRGMKYEEVVSPKEARRW